MVRITVVGAEAIFNLANKSSRPGLAPRGLINGNAIEQATEANYTVAYAELRRPDPQLGHG